MITATKSLILISSLVHNGLMIIESRDIVVVSPSTALSDLLLLASKYLPCDAQTRLSQLG